MPFDVLRVAIHAVTPAIMRSLAARGQTASLAGSGGGQVDLRFRGPDAEVVAQMFDRQVANGEGDTFGAATVLSSGACPEDVVELVYAQPTGARPDERRITRVNGFDWDQRVNPDVHPNLPLIVIVQTSDGLVRILFTNQTDIADQGWDPRIVRLAELIRPKGAGRAKSSVAQDFNVAPLTGLADRVLSTMLNGHPILLSGPPGTGKTLLMSAVKNAFLTGQTSFFPQIDVATQIINVPVGDPAIVRSSFNFPMFPSAKIGDFLSRHIPMIGGSGHLSFQVASGPLYDAMMFAAQDGQAAILTVDEINRGDAVAVFGPAFVGLSRDDRLLPNGNEGPKTQTFPLLRLDGSYATVGLPPRLHILAGRNTADVSTIALDSAFLRRFKEFRIMPDEVTLREHVGIHHSIPLTNDPEESGALIESFIRAFVAVNARIARTDRRDAQMGHGIFMDERIREVDALATVQLWVFSAWERVRTHLEEIYHGQPRVMAAVLNAPDMDDGNDDALVVLAEDELGGQIVPFIEGMDNLSETDMYRLMWQLAAVEAQAVLDQGEDGEDDLGADADLNV